MFLKNRRPMIAIALAGSFIGGCSDANVYDLSADQVYAKLIALEEGTPSVVKVDGVKERVFGTPGKSVTWVTDYAHSYYECTAFLTAESPARTSVNVGCDADNAPAKFQIARQIRDDIVASEGVNLPDIEPFKGVRNRYIELVDSTLDGRPFDTARARSQVMGWPDAPVKSGAKSGG